MVGGGVEGESLPIFFGELGTFCLLLRRSLATFSLLLPVASSSRTW